MVKDWIAVDLDGTCFTYTEWVGWNVFGKPIKPMIDRMKQWVAEGRDVRIMTARVGLPLRDRYSESTSIDILPRSRCRVTGQAFSDAMMIKVIQDLLEKNGLPRLQVQCYKDVDMIEQWDDRAVQVVPNTGQTLADEYEVRKSAESGKAFEG